MLWQAYPEALVPKYLLHFFKQIIGRRISMYLRHPPGVQWKARQDTQPGERLPK